MSSSSLIPWAGRPRIVEGEKHRPPMKLKPPFVQSGISLSCFCQNSPERPSEGLIVRREQVEFLGIEIRFDAAVEYVDERHKLSKR